MRDTTKEVRVVSVIRDATRRTMYGAAVSDVVSVVIRRVVHGATRGAVYGAVHDTIKEAQEVQEVQDA